MSTAVRTGVGPGVERAGAGAGSRSAAGRTDSSARIDACRSFPHSLFILLRSFVNSVFSSLSRLIVWFRFCAALRFVESWSLAVCICTLIFSTSSEGLPIAPPVAPCDFATSCFVLATAISSSRLKSALAFAISRAAFSFAAVMLPALPGGRGVSAWHADAVRKRMS